MPEVIGTTNEDSGSIVTNFTGTATTSTQTFTFTEEQDGMTFRNKGFSAVTVTVDGVTYNVPPVATVEIDDQSFSSFDVKAASGSQTFEIKSFILKSGKATNQEIQDIRASLADMAYNVRNNISMVSNGIWTQAIQSALDSNKTVYIPYSDTPYLIDNRLLLNTNNTIIAHPRARIKLADNTNTCLLRNKNMLNASRDNNIQIIGGIWDGNSANNSATTYSPSDKTNPLRGVGGLINMIGVDDFLISNVTVINAKGFAIQVCTGSNWKIEYVKFYSILRDGIHVGGNTTNFIIRDIFGDTGDDFIALNAWDWYNSTPECGSIAYGTIENLFPSNALRWAIVKFLPGGSYRIDQVTVRNVYGVSQAHCFPIMDDTDLETPSNTITPGSVGTITFENIYCKSNNTNNYYPKNATFRLGTAISKLIIKNWFNDVADNKTLILQKQGFTTSFINIDNLTNILSNGLNDVIYVEGKINTLNINASNVYGNSSSSESGFINVTATGSIDRINLTNSEIDKFNSVVLNKSTVKLMLNCSNVAFWSNNNLINSYGLALVNISNVTFDSCVNMFITNCGASVVCGMKTLNTNITGSIVPIVRNSGQINWVGTDIAIDAMLTTPNPNNIIFNSNGSLACGKGILVRSEVNDQWKNLFTGATS